MAYEDPEELYAHLKKMVEMDKSPPPEEAERRITHFDSWGDNIVLILARSGSTRLKDKNIRLLNGIPLMAYTIILARQLEGIDRVIVSTDSHEYAEIAQSFGAEVPFLRPKSLSEKDSSINTLPTLLIQYLYYMENRITNKIITMLPTNPFRNLGRIQNQVDELITCSHLHTGFHTNVKLDHLCIQSNGGMELIEQYMTGKSPKGNFLKLSGTLTGLHINYKIKFGRKYRYCIIKNPIELIDIDEIYDFELAEAIIKEKMFDFGTDIC